MRFGISVCALLIASTVATTGMSDELNSELVRLQNLAFRLKTLDGDAIDIKPAQRPVTVICFLGTECPLVQLYSPRLSQIADEFRSRGVLFVGINSNFHDTADDIRNYQQRQSQPFPLLRDEGNLVAYHFCATRTVEGFCVASATVVGCWV